MYNRLLILLAFACTDLKIDNLDRVSIPTKIVFTYTPFLGPKKSPQNGKYWQNIHPASFLLKFESTSSIQFIYFQMSVRMSRDTVFMDKVLQMTYIKFLMNFDHRRALKAKRNITWMKRLSKDYSRTFWSCKT